MLDTFHSKLKKKFLQEHSVLLIDLFDIPHFQESQTGKSIKFNFKSLQNSKKFPFRLDLNSFSVGPLDEDIQYYFQVFVPNYEISTIHPVYGPVVAIYDGINDEESIGMYLDSDGNFKIIPEIVNKDFVEKYQVWVVGTNEKIDSTIINFVKNDQSTAKISSVDSWQFSHIWIRYAKEGNLGGLSDVRIRRYSTWFPSGSQINWVGDPDPTRIAKINYALGWEDVYFTYFPSWDPINGFSKGDIFVGLVYEHDNWPAGIRSYSYNLRHPDCPYICATGNQIHFTYRSKETPFFVAQLNYVEIERNRYPEFNPNGNVQVVFADGGFRSVKYR